MDEMKYLAVSKQEAELIMDSFKVSNPVTRTLALKAAGLVLEFAAEEDVREAERFVGFKTGDLSYESVRQPAR